MASGSGEGRDGSRPAPIVCQVPQSGQLPPAWAGAPLCWKACCLHLRTPEEIAARKQVLDQQQRAKAPGAADRILQEIAPNKQQQQQQQQQHPGHSTSEAQKPAVQWRPSTAPTSALGARTSPIKTRTRAGSSRLVAQAPPVPVVDNLATRLKKRVSTASLTIPQDVNLRTSLRAKKVEAPQEVAGRSPFVKSLRTKVNEFLVRNSPTKRPVSAPRTAPRRAQASTSHSKEVVQEAPHRSPFSESLATKLQGFTSSLRRSSPRRAASVGRRELTVAQEPLLRTSVRVRPSHVKSTEELDAEELEHMRPLKARRLNPAILQSNGQVGVPRVPRKEVTHPEPFHFKVDARAQSKAPQEQAQAAAPRNHRYNTRLQHQHQQLHRKEQHRQQPLQLTAPKSPMLMTRLRSAAKGSASLQPQNTASRKPEAPKKDHGLTEPEPFPLATELRGEYHQQVFQRRVGEMEKENAQARQFKAQPLPKTIEQPVLPQPVPRPPLTSVQPFNLRSEVRHQDYKSQREWELQKEQEEQRRATAFKAKPPPEFDRVFLPLPADKPVTVPKEPMFHTDHRAVEREEFDRRQAERMRIAEEERRAHEAARQMEAEQKSLEFRKSLVFQAQPMPLFGPEEVFRAAPSSKPLTVAKTPELSFRKHR